MRNGLIMLMLGMAAMPAVAEEWSKKYAVSGSPDLHVSAGDGKITLRPGSGSEIEAFVRTKGWKISSSEVQILEHQSGNRVEIEIKIPHGERHVDWHNRSIEVELRAPAGTMGHLETGDGSIHIDGMRGDTVARTGDGSIEAVDMEGKLDLHTGDGSVNVRGRVNGLTVETGDGGVDAELAAGSQLGSGWRVQSGDGHITLHLPQDLNAMLDAHTGDGSITVDLPITMEGGIKNQRDVRGKINGGGETIQIRTGDGAIRIEKI